MGSPKQRSPAEMRKLKEELDLRGLCSPLIRLSRTYNVTLDDVLQRRRTMRCTRARDACVWMLSEEKTMSSVEIGLLLGLHWTSVLAARDRYKKRDNGKLAQK